MNYDLTVKPSVSLFFAMPGPYLFNVINEILEEVNYFICVSPDYPSGNCRLDKFMSYFKDEKGYSVISEGKGEINNPSNPIKPWRVYEKVFKVNF